MSVGLLGEWSPYIIFRYLFRKRSPSRLTVSRERIKLLFFRNLQRTTHSLINSSFSVFHEWEVLVIIPGYPGGEPLPVVYLLCHFHVVLGIVDALHVRIVYLVY